MNKIAVTEVIDGFVVEFQIAEHLLTAARSLCVMTVQRLQTQGVPEQDFFVSCGLLKLKRSGKEVQILEFDAISRTWHSDLTTTVTNVCGQQIVAQELYTERVDCRYNEWVTIHHDAFEVDDLHFVRNPTEDLQHSGWVVKPAELLGQGVKPSPRDYSLEFTSELVRRLDKYVPQFLTLPHGSTLIYECPQNRLTCLREHESLKLLTPNDLAMISEGTFHRS